MTPQEKIKNNEFLLNLDMDNASHEQKIIWLCQIIKNETEKPEDQRDLDLIAECSEYLEELSEEEANPTKEQMENALQEIKANHAVLNKSVSTTTKRPRRLLKIVAVAAAIFVALFSTLTVAAKMSGYSSAWEMVVENIQRILNMESGDSFEEGGITLIKNDKVIAYSSIEKLISEEGYSIIYPDNMPNGIQITRITQQNVSEDQIILTFQFTDPNLTMSASTMQSIREEDLLDDETHDIDGMIFYVDKMSIGLYQAIGHDSIYEYYIVSEDYNLLISILNNMEGIKK